MFHRRYEEMPGPCFGHHHHAEKGHGRGSGRLMAHPRLIAHPKLFLFPAILSLLDEEPAHGYALVGKLTELGLASQNTNPTTVYRILSRMEYWGLVEHEHVDEGQGPARKVYRLTEEGRSDLIEWSKRLNEATKFIKWFDERHPAPAD